MEGHNDTHNIPVLVIDFTNQTDLVEHDIIGHRRGLVVSDNGYHSMV